MRLARMVDTSCTNPVYMLHSLSEIGLLTYFRARLFSLDCCTGRDRDRRQLQNNDNQIHGLAYWLHPGTGMHGNRAYFRHYRDILGYIGAILRAAVIVHIGARVGRSCWVCLLADA